MALEALLQFKNIDSTENLNARLAGLVPKGVLKGGIVAAEPASLQVRVKGVDGEPWVLLAFASDGMVIRERAEEHVVPVTAGITNVIVLRAKYLASSVPLASLEVMSLGTYQNDPDKDSLIRLASVAPPANATSVSPDDIDLSFRDSIEGFSRRIVREVVDTRADLPAVSGFPATAEINFIGNDFVTGTSITVSTGLITETFPIVPSISFLIDSPAAPGLSRLNTFQKTILTAIEASLTGVVTVTTSTNHGFLVNDEIRISGASAVAANGVWIVTAIVSPTVFEYTKSGSATPFSSTGGTVVDTSALATVTVKLAPGVTHDLVLSQPITITNAVDQSFNVTSNVTSIIDAQTFTYDMAGFPTADSGNGEVTKVGFTLPVNAVPIGASETITANNFEEVFRASSLAPIINATAIGSSIQLETTNVGVAGNSYTLAKSEPGVLSGSERIVISGPTFTGGVDPLPSSTSNVDLRSGDVYVVIHGDVGSMELWGYDGVRFINLTSSSTATLLDFHRRNLLANEKHLTENEKAAIKGTVGIPSSTNRFVTEQDTSVLTASLAAALQGADEEQPSGTNKFLTEARWRGKRSDISVPALQDYVQLATGERWVVGTAINSAIQYFNVVFTSTLFDPGGPTEYTQQDFTPVTITGFYFDTPFIPANELNPADSLQGADAKGIYPRLDASILGNPIDLYVKLSHVPDNGSCTVLYSLAEQEKVRGATEDQLMGPQRIVPASLRDIENKTSELRFNTGISVSGTSITFPASLFSSSNLQGLKFRRTVGGKWTTLSNTFTIDLNAGSGTGGIVTSFTPVTFPAANNWTRYLLALTRDNMIRVYNISSITERTTDVIFDTTSTAISLPTNPLTNGDYIFASVLVQSNGTNTGLQNLVLTNVELYPFQGTNSKEPGSEILVGDNSTSFGHFSGSTAHIRALSFASPGDTIRLLPGVYTGQWLINKSNITVKFENGAELRHILASESHSFAPGDVNTVSETITISGGHTFENGHTVVFSTTGTLPSPLSASTTYYVVSATSTTFKVALTAGGSAVNLSTTGSGTHTVEMQRLCLNVNAASFVCERPHFAQCAVAVNLTANATDCYIEDPHFHATVTQNFAAVSTLSNPNVSLRQNDVATWTCTDGSGQYIGDFNSASALNDALAAASPGDTILAYPGTYSRITNWNKNNIHLSGFGSSEVFIDGGGTNPAITVSAVGNHFSNLTLQNASVGIDCVSGSSYNIFDATVAFSNTVTINVRFPTTGGTKHFNWHPLYSGNISVSTSTPGESFAIVTCGDGTSSWGDYVGQDAINQALSAEQTGTIIKVGKGTYVPIDGVSFSNMTIEGSGANCVIQATSSDSHCVFLNGNSNRFKNFFLQATGNNTVAYNVWGVEVEGNDNIIDGMLFDDTGANFIAPHRRYNIRSGLRNKFMPHTGAPTGYTSWTVGDGRVSFGDHSGLNAIQNALSFLPARPRGTNGALSNISGDQADFDDFSVPAVVNFNNVADPYYVPTLNRYLTITSGVGANQGSWKVITVLGPTKLRLQREDSGSFSVESGLIWQVLAGSKIWVLPGTYEEFSLSKGVNDLDLEAWGAGGDVIIDAGANPGVIVQGSRNRISGFRFEGSAAGVQLEGSDNTFEKNKFNTPTRYTIASTALRNKIYDSIEDYTRTAYTVSASPSRADFVGSSHVAIQAALDAASADPHCKRVFIGAGTYTLTTTVTVPTGVTVFGSGYDTHVTGAIATGFTLTNNVTVTNIRFSGFATDDIGGTATGVFVYGCWTPNGFAGTVIGQIAMNN